MTKPCNAITVLASSLVVLAITAYNYHQKKLKDVTDKLSSLRDAERKGKDTTIHILHMH